MASKAGIAVAVVGTVATPPTIYYTHKLLTSYIPAPKAPVISVPTDSIPATTLSQKRDDGKAFENAQGCIKDKFPNLGEINSKLNTETKDDSNKQALATHSPGTIEGCLTADLMWRNQTPKQHAIAGTLEMTLTKGGHGLIFRTLITNLFEGDTAFQYINQLFKLTKESSGQWKIDDGYLWTDEGYNSLSSVETTEKSKLIFDGLVKAEISYKDLCKRGNIATGSDDQQCSQIATTDRSFAPLKLQKQKWTSNSTGKEIFQHLTIKGGKEGAEKTGDLWGNKSDELFKGGWKTGLAYLYEKNKGFVKIQYKDGDETVKNNLTAWFAPFKTEKGAWS